ncbi:LytTr DNA-binding domain-containing protein [Neolewinella agarilytica]|uniref:LytTr DNA-binding domain-containing protein n=2 Tax=Neolewinella agarilytica TaxID=478744 RepID=A0A1H9GWX9_9BACT|nr:LytTr DNA-binding domain-containing protein [Neolewinella agarilytica]
MNRNLIASTFPKTSHKSLAPLAKNDRNSNDPFDKEGQSIWVEKGKVRVRIPVRNILYVKAEHVYCRLFFPNDQRVLKRISLDRLTSELPSGKFLRVHRSYLVNVDYVEHFNASKILIGKTVIPIGRTWRKEAVSRLRQLIQ